MYRVIVWTRAGHLLEQEFPGDAWEQALGRANCLSDTFSDCTIYLQDPDGYIVRVYEMLY